MGSSPVSSQSPSLRGSGRFLSRRTAGGQRRTTCFNPLHCGAVVASPPGANWGGAGHRVSIPFIAGQWSLLVSDYQLDVIASFSFNPLHCGAVVASGAPSCAAWRRAQVSIPFIAGQWSLHAARHVDERTLVKFQSPSLRGSGRFGSRHLTRYGSVFSFQSPSLRGSGRFDWSMFTLYAQMA